jgi:hypothetical protein
MQRIWIAACAVIVSVGIGLSAGQQPAAPAGTGVIQGVVRRPDTQVPIDGVSLTLSRGPSCARTSCSALTDREGRFRFANLATGTYQLTARKERYVIKDAVQQGGAPNITTTAVVDVVVGGSQNSSSTVLELIPGGRIIGRILDPSGNPLSGLSVEAMAEDYTDGHRILQSTRNTVTSDDRGEFRIWGLVPGPYYVRVLTRGSSRGGIPIYSPSALDPRNAQKFTVRADEESRADIDIVVASPIKISGQVTGPAAALSNGVQFTFIPRDLDLWDRAMALAPPGGSADGKFELSVSKPGLYDLYATAFVGTPAARGTLAVITARYVGRVPVDVRDKEIANLIVPLLPLVEIQARVLGNQDATVNTRGASSQLSFQSLGPVPSLSMRGPAPPDQSGWQTFFLAADVRYFVNNFYQGGGGRGLFQDVYVADIRQGSKSIYEDGMIVVNRNNPEPIEVTLARSGGTIEGVVRDSVSKPVALSMVTLVPDGPRRKNPIFYKLVQSGSDGQFTIQGVAPGSYKIFAWENIPRGAERNAEFLKPFETRGQSITVGANFKASNLTLSVIRRPLQ